MLYLAFSDPTKHREPLVVGFCIFVSVFLVAIISIALVFRFPKHTQTWADVLGTIAGVLAAIQYLPQIYYTWKLQDLKSLSVATLVIQAPGAFVFALSLGLRVGVAGWSTWLVYLVTGALQFVLLAMAINWWFMERNAAKVTDTPETRADTEENRGSAPPVDETTALLTSRPRSAS